jgi:putative ABC transport system permease protein
MNWIRQLWTRRQLEADLREEIRGHLEERVESLVADGLSPADAWARARREFGNVTLIEERGRDVWRWSLVEDTWADLRYAVRQLRRTPSFTVAAVLTLALGLGVNTAVFSVVNAILFKPLPFPDPERLVSIELIDRRHTGRPSNVSYPIFFDFRRENRVFEHIVSYRDDAMTLTGRGQPTQVTGQIVSWDLFQLLGVQPVLGRAFVAAEEQKGQRSVIVSHDLWTSRFEADPAIVGQKAVLDGEPFTIVGVAPAGFEFPIRRRHVEVWTTLARDAASDTVTPVTEQRGARMLDVTARLRPGVSLDAAHAALDQIAGALARAYPDQNGNVGRTYLRPELERLVGPARAPMLILFGAVGLVLLITCANLANMLLARTTDRERELAIRMASGGSRARVVRQLVGENMLLALIGAVAAVFFAAGIVQLIVPIAKESIPRALGIRIDVPVLVFSLIGAILTSLLFSMPAALRVARGNVGERLHDNARTTTDRNERLRAVLVVAQVAIGLMLSIAASMLVADFARMMNKDLGLRPENVLTFDVGLNASYSADRRVDLIARLLERLRTVPGATATAAAMPLPLTGSEMTISFDIEERPSLPSRRPSSNVAIVTPGYFKTIGTRVIAGRDFTEHDDDNGPGVAIVNQAFAARFFPGERAIGKRFESGATSRRGPVMREIVGIVDNARQSVFGGVPEPVYYLPFRQMPWGPPSLLVRTAVPPLTLESSVRSAVLSLDKDVPINHINTLDGLLFENTAGPRFRVILMTTFAVLALLLTATGLYGVLAYAVLRRTREIGVRVALGASSRAVVNMVVSRALRLVSAGAILGGAGALAASRILRSMLDDAQHADVRMFLLAAFIVAGTAAVAALMPARRAAAIDPIQALRTE